MSLQRPTRSAFGASLAAVVVVLGVARFGVLGVVAPLLVAGAVALIARPELALGIAVGLPLLIEPEADWGPSPVPARLYELIPGTKLDPLELLVLLALLAATLDRSEARPAAHRLGILTGPLALLAVALVAGAVTGRDAGSGISTLINTSRNPLLLLVVPLVVVRVVGTRVTLRRALGVGLALAAVKGLVGLAALLTGQTAVSVGDRALTYYAAPTNALTMFALLFCAVAALRRLRLPAWAWAAVPFMTASLLLSYRRSFWVATVLGLVLVLLFAVGRQSRRLGIPAIAAVAVALLLTLGGSVSSGLTPTARPGDSGLRGRLGSLNPTAISQSKDDRYRLGERRNVVAALRAAPVAGLGLGVEYRARYPLSLGSLPRDYVHFAALWWWMKTGILGLLGYVWMLVAAMWAGARVFRGHPDPVIRAAGLAAAAGVAGFAVAETTATFVGPDPRSSVFFGALLGLLAVAHGETREAPRPSIG